jgi:hypothetical protein
MPSTFVAAIGTDEPIREHKNLYGKGITPSYSANKDVVQITFTNHSLESAQLWLKEHEYPDVELKEVIVEEQAEKFSRNFGYPFTSEIGKFEKTPEGGLRVRGVKLLAAGTWTDSAQKTACEYSPDVLNRFAGNWADNAIWSRHFGGVPRNITEKVGIVENPRYENEAVVGDLYYHGLTQQSRDTITMIDNGLANFVSVETISKDKWNVGKKVYQADELGFTGLATVNQGACRVCKIRDNEAVMEDITKELAASVPSNPSGSGIGPDAQSCSLTLKDFTDKTWEDLTPEEKSGVASHFGYNDGTDSFGALKLPHHDPKTGEVRPNCVRAALQAIGGARSGTPMNLGGKEKAVHEHLQAHQDDVKTEKEAEAMMDVVVQEEVLRENPDPAHVDVVVIEEPDMDNKELEELVVKQAETIKELSARIETIEKTPVPKTLGESAVEKEYEIPPFQVSFENGIIKRRE